MYWSDTGTRTIERVSMDGKNRTPLHTTSLTTPYGLTIDYATQTLYWADYTLNKIESSNTDGSNRNLVTSTNIRDPYSITFFGGSLYWTDLSFNGIYSTLISSPNQVTSLLSLGVDPYGIKVIAEEVQFEGRRLFSCSIYCSDTVQLLDGNVLLLLM